MLASRAIERGCGSDDYAVVQMTTDGATPPLPPPDELRVRRLAERADYDAATVRHIVDAALIAHVGTVRDGKPVVVPMLCVRDDDYLLLHGAPATGSIKRGRGMEVCVTMTLFDGLVLARSAFHHSINYRSVVVLGIAEVIRDETERRRALDLITERLVPGRGAELRPTTSSEVRQTAVLRLSLAHASTKIRQGPPGDDEADYDLPIWAGVVPAHTIMTEAIPDPRLGAGIATPDHVRVLAGKRL